MNLRSLLLWVFVFAALLCGCKCARGAVLEWDADAGELFTVWYGPSPRLSVNSFEVGQTNRWIIPEQISPCYLWLTVEKDGESGESLDEAFYVGQPKLVVAVQPFLLIWQRQSVTGERRLFLKVAVPTNAPAGFFDVEVER